MFGTEKKIMKKSKKIIRIIRIKIITRNIKIIKTIIKTKKEKISKVTNFIKNLIFKTISMVKCISKSLNKVKKLKRKTIKIRINTLIIIKERMFINQTKMSKRNMRPKTRAKR